jgi:hypothetical protein
LTARSHTTSVLIPDATLVSVAGETVSVSDAEVAFAAVGSGPDAARNSVAGSRAVPHAACGLAETGGGSVVCTLRAREGTVVEFAVSASELSAERGGEFNTTEVGALSWKRATGLGSSVPGA